jgi:hypothetical protein
MDKIIDQAAQWAYLQQIPAEYAGFSLDPGQERQESQYVLFSYRRPVDRRSFSVLYDGATRDFMARVTIGLTEYYDLNFITGDFAALESVLNERLRPTLEMLAGLSAQNHESIFQAKKISCWPYCDSLPEEKAGFRLFIDPCHPVKTINGSYIIIDYSDFTADSNLTICYNIFRDEFFGEIRLQRTPRAINLFDSRELTELADKMELHLVPTLVGLRGEIDRRSTEGSKL